MIANAILASAGPEVDNVRVVAKRQDSSLRQTLGQERLWPDDLFLRPRLLAMPGQAVDEDKTVNEPDSVRDTYSWPRRLLTPRYEPWKAYAAQISHIAPWSSNLLYLSASSLSFHLSSN